MTTRSNPGAEGKNGIAVPCLVRADQSELFALAEELLAAGKEVMMTPTGTSMLPTLRSGRDAVCLTTPGERLHRGDIVLYRRMNGQYVLHRIIALARDGSYVLCGDNQTSAEPGIQRSQILASVRYFQRGSLKIDCAGRCYRFYSLFWMVMRFPRRCIHFFRHRVGLIVRKIFCG